MRIVGSWSDAVLEKKKIQNHKISSDLDVNSKAMVLSMTYLNVIDDILHLRIVHNLEILHGFLKNRDASETNRRDDSIQ